MNKFNVGFSVFIACVFLAGFSFGPASLSLRDARQHAVMVKDTFKHETKVFEANTAIYVRYMLKDGEPNAAATDALVKNLFAMIRASDDIHELLPPDLQYATGVFSKDVENLIQTVQCLDDVQDMKEFWEQVSATLTLREIIFKAI